MPSAEDRERCRKILPPATNFVPASLPSASIRVAIPMMLPLSSPSISGVVNSTTMPGVQLRMPRSGIASSATTGKPSFSASAIRLPDRPARFSANRSASVCQLPGFCGFAGLREFALRRSPRFGIFKPVKPTGIPAALRTFSAGTDGGGPVRGDEAPVGLFAHGAAFAGAHRHHFVLTIHVEFLRRGRRVLSWSGALRPRSFSGAVM